MADHPNKGRKQSPEHIAKRIESRRNSGNFAKLSEEIIKRNKERTGTKHTQEHKDKIAAAMKGKRNALGTVRDQAFKDKLSEYWTDNPNHNHYVDGKYAERQSERAKDMSRLEYRTWRAAVFKRDDWTCVKCSKRGGELQADHIKPYSLFPDLRYDVDNGRTMCRACHKTTDTYAGRITSYKKNIEI